MNETMNNTNLEERMTKLETEVEQQKKESELKVLIEKAKKEYQHAELEFKQCPDDGLIDYYTYNIKAKESLYEYYLRKIKDVDKNNLY